MPTIDVITQICVFCDYPIWRSNMTKYRDKVKKIILYPSRHHGVVDFERFAKQVFAETWVDPVSINYAVEDWRQAETIPCLTHSNAEWIWFSEQDFFVDDWDRFYDLIKSSMKNYDMIGWWNETAFPYIHPCCLFIKRELLEKTKKDFRAHPDIPGCDHFAMLTRDAESCGARIRKLQDCGYVAWENAFHLGGLTYPYQDWKGDGTDHFGVGNPECFYVYNYFSRKALTDQSLDYFDLSGKLEQELKKRFPDVDPQTSKWAKFFT